MNSHTGRMRSHSYFEFVINPIPKLAARERKDGRWFCGFVPDGFIFNTGFCIFGSLRSLVFFRGDAISESGLALGTGGRMPPEPAGRDACATWGARFLAGVFMEIPSPWKLSGGFNRNSEIVTADFSDYADRKQIHLSRCAPNSSGWLRSHFFVYPRYPRNPWFQLRESG